MGPMFVHFLGLWGSPRPGKLHSARFDLPIVLAPLNSPPSTAGSRELFLERTTDLLSTYIGFHQATLVSALLVSLLWPQLLPGCAPPQCPVVPLTLLMETVTHHSPILGWESPTKDLPGETKLPRSATNLWKVLYVFFVKPKITFGVLPLVKMLQCCYSNPCNVN